MTQGAPAAATPRHSTMFTVVLGWLLALAAALRIPSPIVEFAGGVVLVLLAALAVQVLTLWVALLAIATVASYLYEERLDARGWSLGDFVLREVGILVAVLVGHVVLHVL